jgi:tetratricopeptide (TPR) repeat protein
MSLISDYYYIKNEKIQADKYLEQAIEIAKTISDHYGSRLKVMTQITVELLKQNKIYYAIRLIREEHYHKNIILSRFTIALAKNNETEVIESILNSLNNIYDKCNMLIRLSTEFLEKDSNISSKFKKNAIEIIDKLDDIDKKESVIENILDELLKQGAINEAYNLLSFLSNLRRNMSLVKISKELVIKDLLSKAVFFITEISNLQERFLELFSIGKTLFETKGYKSAIETLSQFSNPEAIKYIRKGIIESINLETLTPEIALDIFKHPESEIADIEKIMQYFAIDQLFFEELLMEKIQRYNRTLNIQWAIDIKNQLPN